MSELAYLSTGSRRVRHEDRRSLGGCCRAECAAGDQWLADLLRVVPPCMY